MKSEEKVKKRKRRRGAMKGREGGRKAKPLDVGLRGVMAKG